MFWFYCEGSLALRAGVRGIKIIGKHQLTVVAQSTSLQVAGYAEIGVNFLKPQYFMMT